MKNIKDMLDFHKSHKHVFLYQFDEGREYAGLTGKYLSLCSFPVEGVITAGGKNEKSAALKKGEGPYWTIEEVREKFAPGECGVILSVFDFLLNAALGSLTEAGFHNVFFITDYYRKKIQEKLTPRTKENFILEVNLADHCNLNCQMCDHFSPLAEKHFLDPRTFIQDMGRLADLTDNTAGVIKILGGEPLLNPDTPDFLIAARGLFPQSRILLYTNGLLLAEWETKHKANLWEICRRFNARIMVTTYPINFDYAKIDALAVKHKTPYSRFVEESENDLDKNTALYNVLGEREKKSVHHPLSPAGNVPVHEFIDCYHFNRCITLSGGKLYTCPIIPYAKYFSAFFDKPLKTRGNDFIDIYAARDFEEIAEFLSRPVPFCRYCKVSSRKGGVDFRLSKKAIEEWT
ncbi:MAG: radical SAM protein [Treponema sp.]|nr:radical SAM protein [Treponema sp.]